jgi:hypothetical protein
MNKAVKSMVIVIAVFSIFSTQSQAYTFLVTNSTQLQNALNTARTNGEDDEIRLTYGTYNATGPFTYGTASNDNHSVTLSGGWNPLIPGFQSNDAEATVLDGNNLNPVLQIDANAASVNITFNIENLTIENGYARSADYAGAGILAFAGSNGNINLTLNNCVMQNNNADNGKSGGAIYSEGNSNIEAYNSRFLSSRGANGGAIFQYNSFNQAMSPIFDNCYFEDNSNYSNQGSSIWTNCAAKISNCTFKGMISGGSSGIGSCVWGYNGSHLNITNSTFTGITIMYWGAAVQVFDGDLDITNCLFANNHSGVDGDGRGVVAFASTGSAYTINITNCTFSGNTATASYAGAVDNRGGTINLNNCIFWDNDGETGVNNDSYYPGTIAMKYCVYDNSSMGYGVTDGGNNFYRNPIFIDDDVFRLSADSPCIDAGNNDLVPADALDVDNDGNTAEPTPLDVAGKVRFRDDPYTADTNVGTAPIVDMGAYEFVQTARFGYVSGKKNVKLTLKGSDNNDVTFALSGAPYAYGTTDPCDPNFELIEIYNNNDGAEKAALAISTKAKTGSRVGSINCFGPMKSITAKNIDLTGDMTIGSTMNPKAAAAITFDQGNGLNINSDMPIKSISAYEWWGSLTAPSVGSITTKSAPKLDKWGYLSMDVETGVIGSVKTAGGIDGTWDCKSVKSITASSTDDFYLTLSQEPNVKVPALGTLTVKGGFEWSRIISAGNIGTVTVGNMRNANCFAGVADACMVDVNAADDVYDLPLVLGDTFNQTATIKSISIKGIKSESSPYFVNSNIAATNILSVSIVYPEYNNSGIPFGVSMLNTKTFKIKDSEGTHSWKGIDIGEAIDWLTNLGYDMKIRRD